MSAKEKWLYNLRDKKFLTICIITVLFLIGMLSLLTQFLLFNESRAGVVIDDPLLKLFNPVDVTWLTFILIYAALIIGTFTLGRNPKSFLCAIQAYIVMVLIRIIAMYSLSLDPPSNMIILEDPFVSLVSTGDIYVKDLFFSGHTSTMFLLFLTAEKKGLKAMFLAFTVLVALCVLIQHVHYSVDVVVAPMAAYAAYRIIQISKKHYLK